MQMLMAAKIAFVTKPVHHNILLQVRISQFLLRPGYPSLVSVLVVYFYSLAVK